MAKSKKSETITENIFRGFYIADNFIEKSAIPDVYGFKSKRGTQYKGYPDFFMDVEDYSIVVEAKSDDLESAEKEVLHYMKTNNIKKDIIGIAVSGQSLESLSVSYFLRNFRKREVTAIDASGLISVPDIEKLYLNAKYGESVSDEHLTDVLNSLNKRFNGVVRDTERSLFFSGLMIALKDLNFRSTYDLMQTPSKEEAKSKNLRESYHLNEAILKAISTQLEDKINNLSKQINWIDKFSFIRDIDFSLVDYKLIINEIEREIFRPFQNNEKHDILGKAYKIFLKRAGKIDNKNIILTPDHIKSLMIELARLDVADVVLDTCTGTGGFLMEAMERMVKLANNNSTLIGDIKNKQLIGFEIDTVLFALACSNMFLHGDGRTNMIYRSSLLEDDNDNVIGTSNDDVFSYIRQSKPTKCIINPPYENNSSIKFTRQAIEYLEPNGRLVIIMPTPTLKQNQGGLTEELLKMAKLDFVIKMPNKLFSEQKRCVNTSIFGFTKTPHNQNDDVLFYNLEDDGLVSVQHKGRIDRYGRWANIKDHVVDAISNHNEIAGVCEKRKIYRDGVLNSIGFQTRNKESQMFKIDELFEVKKGSLASEKSIEGDFHFITGSEEWKTHCDYSHDMEALVYIVGAAGSLGRCHYVNDKFIASNLSLILTPKRGSGHSVNLRFYSTYFNHFKKKMVSDLSDGTSKLTIREEDLKSYYVDYIDIEEQNKFVEKYVVDMEDKKRRFIEEIKVLEGNINREIEDML